MEEYAYSQKIQNEPAFGWSVHKVLKKQDCIVTKLKTNRNIRKQIKFDVEIPETIEEAKLFDKQNKNEM